MIRFLLALLLGVAIGYTYGYLQADAGDDNLISAGMEKAGVRRFSDSAQASVNRLRREELRRQAVLDSLRQARADSISSAVHH